MAGNGLEIFTGSVGLTVAALIVYLIRRDHMHARYSIWWLVIALATALLGFFPRIIDTVGVAIGIAYPPVLALIGGVLALLVKILYADLERSRLRRELLRLTQRLLIVEESLNELRHQQRAPAPPPEDRGTGGR
jgi:hypothetical protein